MAKRRRVLTFRLPPYTPPRNTWRREILRAAVEAASKRGVVYEPGQPLEVVVILYMRGSKRILIHDVDNRLKDVLDALGGHFSGAKAEKAKRILKNDNCVYRASVEKRPVPKKFKNRKPGDQPGGKVTISKYRNVKDRPK